MSHSYPFYCRLCERQSDETKLTCTNEDLDIYICDNGHGCMTDLVYVKGAPYFSMGLFRREDYERMVKCLPETQGRDD